MSKPDKKLKAFPIGIGIGVAIGAGLGVAISNAAIGAGVGISLALVFGMLLRVMRVTGISGNSKTD